MNRISTAAHASQVRRGSVGRLACCGAWHGCCCWGLNCGGGRTGRRAAFIAATNWARPRVACFLRSHRCGICLFSTVCAVVFARHPSGTGLPVWTARWRLMRCTSDCSTGPFHDTCPQRRRPSDQRAAQLAWEMYCPRLQVSHAVGCSGTYQLAHTPRLRCGGRTEDSVLPVRSRPTPSQYDTTSHAH